MTSIKAANPKKQVDLISREPVVPELRWIQLTAGIASLIGMVGLLALMAQNVRAADNSGFNPGSRPFPSPFANSPQGGSPPPPAGGGKGFFDEEEDEEFDFGGGGGGFQPSQDYPPPSGGGGGRGGAPSADSRRGGGGNNPVSMGGGNPSGVIPNPNARSIQIDTETGEGSKELVTDFNFPDADIIDIAKTLGKLTGKNFILDKDVKGKITIISNGPITVSDAWKAFLTALDVNQFALIPSGKFIRIARQRDARDKQLKTYTGDYSPDTDALITRVFPLKYIDAEEVARTFRSFMPANSRIIPYEQTNTVIVTDTGSNISKLSKMLEILDVEGYDVGIEVIPVKFASAVELSKLIDTLIPGTGGGTAPGGAPRLMGGGGGRGFSARRTKEGGVINTIIADERTNTLIVHANTKGADQVRELVAKLDQKLPAQTGGGKVHVVYLQFADAEQITGTLNSLSQSSGPIFRPISPGGGTGTGVNPVASSLFEGAIKVSADKSTNSLVINASPADFVTVQRVINRLDIPRDEVFVECVIMEIGMRKDFEYSANLASPASAIGLTPNQDLYTFLANPAALSGAVLGFKSGGTQNITINNQSVQVSSVQGLIKLIQTNSKSNVLATPQIIALDNSEANFESAEKIPVPVSTTSNGVIQNSISKENVALSIKIKPQINKMSNFVKLDITTKLGDISNRVLPKNVADSAFATVERTAQTTVVVGDSDTVVIGGLMRDNVNETVSKIPLLGDIPVLGWLFSARSSNTEKTNLLIFMTPHIVRQYEKVRAILDRKLQERDQFIEQNAGGDDPLRATRDKIIRQLPDIKELSSRKVDRSVTIGAGNEEQGAQAVEPNSDIQQTPRRDGNPFTGPKGGAQSGGNTQSQSPGTAGSSNSSSSSSSTNTPAGAPVGSPAPVEAVPPAPPAETKSEG